METRRGQRCSDATDQHRTRRPGRMLVVLVGVLLLILTATALCVMMTTASSDDEVIVPRGPQPTPHLAALPAESCARCGAAATRGESGGRDR